MCADCDSKIDEGCVCVCEWKQLQYNLYCEKCRHWYIAPDPVPAPATLPAQQQSLVFTITFTSNPKITHVILFK